MLPSHFRHALRRFAPAGVRTRWVGVFLAVLLVLYFVLLGAFLSVRYVVLPRVPEWRPEIEAAATRALGRPVSVGALEADWRGLRPRLKLNGVVLRDAEGRAALSLDRVEAAVAWSSLLRGRLELQRLEVVGPSLDIRREASGRILVAGLPVNGEASPQGSTLDRLLTLHALVVRDARVTWTDEVRGAPALALQGVQLRLENRGGRHRFGLSARSPGIQDSAFEIRGDLEGEADAPLAQWRGELFLNLPQAELGAWQRWVDYPVAVQAGRGSVRAWLRRDRPGKESLTAELALQGLSVRVEDGLPPLVLAQLEGRLDATREDGRQSLTGERLVLAEQGHAALAPVDLKFVREAGRDGHAPTGSLDVRALDVGAWSRLAAALPLPVRWHRTLAELAPQGRIETVSLTWRGEEALPAAWRIDARFAELGARADGEWPGGAGWSGRVRADQDGGEFDLRVREGALELPQIFEQGHIALAEGRFEGDWRQRDGETDVHFARGDFRNADAQGGLSGRYRTGKGGGYTDMEARIVRARATAVHRYIPSALSAELRTWLREGLLAGHAEDARMRLKGPLAQFPFRHGEGEFHIEAQARGILMAYAPGWPTIEALDGQLVFDRARMDIRTEGGAIFGTRLGKVHAYAADLELPLLVVEGEALGPTAEFLRFVNASPIANRVGYFTQAVQTRGDGRLTLRLDIPLEDAEATRVAGDYVLSSNRLSLGPGLPDLEEASARLGFTENALSVHQGSARFLGAPLSISGETRADGAMVIDARGSLATRQLAELAPSPLWAHVTGETPVSARVTVREHEVLLALDSSLLGVVSSLPDPFNKPASASRPARIEWRWMGGRDGVQQTVGLRLADIARAEVHREGEGASATLRGAFALGSAPLILPDKGLRLRADLPFLDADAWARVAPAAARGGGLALPLDGVELRVGTLRAKGFTFARQTAVAAPAGDGWAVQLEGPDAAGSLRWESAGAGRLTANLSRLALRENGDRSNAKKPASVVEDAEPLPAMDLSVRELTLGARALGTVLVRGAPTVQGWQLNRLFISNPDGEIEAWGAQSGSPLRAELRLALDASDVGRLLGRLGYPGTVRGGRAQLTGALAWRGPLTGFDVASLAGEARLQANAGSFSQIDPGLGGRLLGVLSLQSLRRRASLDFQDVFAQGFAFDTLAGSMKINDGLLRTEDLRIDGPAATVRMRGSVNLAAETQSLRVEVQPTLSETVAVGAAIAPAIGAVNPLVGVAAYLAQKALADPVERIFAYEYVVEGSWADPQLRRATAPQRLSSEGK